MRKLLAILLVASMLATVALCAFAVSAAEPENVAAGKSYVTSPLHRQGGKEVNWAWDENAPITYEDTNGVELTDGLFPADISYQDPAFFGFSHSTPGYEDRGNYNYIRVDLEAVYDLGLLKMYFGSAALKNGIGVSGLVVSFYKVDDLDGTNPVEIGTVSDIQDEDPEDADAKGYVCAELEVETSARFIEIRLTRGGWVFVTEFEAFAADGTPSTPDEPKEPEVVEEVIAVDGDLNDTGWVKAEWIDNGFWQGVQEGEYPGDDITGKYSVRTDEENIYIAFVMNTIAPNTTEAYDANSFVQSSASNIRIWFKKDVETRTFFDIQYNGTEFTLANWNTTYEAPSENTEYKVTYADGKLTAEIAVNMKDLGIEDSFYLLVTYSETFETGYNAIHFTTAETLNDPEGGDYADYWHVNNTYSYTQYTVADLALGTYTVDPEPDEPEDTYEQDIAALVGDLLDDPDFAINLESEIETVDGKNIMTVTLTVKDIKEGVHMQALLANLYFDTERLTLLTEISEKDNSVQCVSKLPYGDDSDWENMTKLSKDVEGLIEINFIVADTPDQYLDAEHPIELVFTFELKEGFTKAGVYVTTEGTESTYAPADPTASDFATYYGNGAYTVASVKAVEEPSNSDSTSSTETKPGNGDNGILVFAILGVLAVAGAATVIKVRH